MSRMSGGRGRREILVAQEGTGHFLTVQEAIDAVPLGNTLRTVIRIASGVYTQPVYVPKTKNFITICGSSPERTTLRWNNTATALRHHQESKVIGTGTFACGSVIVEGEDFIAENLTFENNAPQGSGQAVAIRVTADRCAFYNCRFLGWQDTAYLHYGRHYLRDCYIEGSVDFIFGNATVFFENCHIHCKSKGFITAQKRNSADETSGFVFLRCVVTGTGDSKLLMHLGRPWGPYARVVFAYSHLDGCIAPAGWNNWDNPDNERTSCFFEYRCTGPGSDTRKRVPWARMLHDSEARHYMSPLFIDAGRNWLNFRDQSFGAPSIPLPFSA